ncbi:MAG TPA: 2-oxoacid:acceptor oxidoreductase subunit alpha [Bacillota bacterium]
MTKDFSVTIGGDAGQGIESSGATLTRALMRAGWHVFSMVDYRSRIRGGHNFYQIRVAERPLYSHRDPVHLLLAMTEETLKIHLDNLAEGAAVVYDEGFKRVDAGAIRAQGLRAYPAPLARLAADHGSRVMMNTAALGVAAALLGIERRPLEEVLRDGFADKGSRVAEANARVLAAGYEWGLKQRGDFRYRLDGSGPASGERRMALHGNYAFGLGALAGGCRFMAAYPMTPATSLFEFMVAHSHRTGVVTKHAEDEIAAACMAIGAAHAGARSLTGTSGGGFSLMVEALGMAGMVELPLVIFLAQRGGPSTGLPTRTEQGDLLFTIFASQGEFPRIVLAPGTVEACYEAGWRAFNLAEKYQCPVIVLSDQFLSSSLRDLPLEALRLEDVHIDRGATLVGADLLDRLREPYLRFRATADGISPRAIPGHPRGVYALTTDEHDEEGHITEEIGNRRQQMEKRMRKLETAKAEMRGPHWYGPPEAELTLICWGSTYGPCREAVDEAVAAGHSVNLLHFEDLWPLPVDNVEPALGRIRHGVVVEQNYTSQFARLLRMLTGYEADGTVNKYDGRPFAPGEILEAVDRELSAHV